MSDQLSALLVQADISVSTRRARVVSGKSSPRPAFRFRIGCMLHMQTLTEAACASTNGGDAWVRDGRHRLARLQAPVCTGVAAACRRGGGAPQAPTCAHFSGGALPRRVPIGNRRSSLPQRKLVPRSELYK